MLKPQTLTRDLFQPALPPRKSDAHKGCFGSVAIIGGGEGMVGAVLLASRAALLAGAGRVYGAMICQNAPIVDVMQPEIMLRTPTALSSIAQLNCIVIGPGLGQSPSAQTCLAEWLSQQFPMLLDADALNLIASQPYLAQLVKNRQAETIITPHVGEAARLLESSIAHIQQNRAESAQALAQKFNAICVLKGQGTVIATTQQDCFINTTGNPALATAGTGDVLSGTIGSLIAQGLNAVAASKLGVFVHGLAADQLVEKGLGPVGITASEIALGIRDTLNALSP